MTDTTTTTEPEVLSLGETVMRLVSMGLVARKGQTVGETATGLVYDAKHGGWAGIRNAGKPWRITYQGGDTFTMAPAPGPTPGYNCRLTIFFDHDRNGRKVAYYWGRTRAIRLPLADAELMQSTETADVVCCHPMRPHKCGKG